MFKKLRNDFIRINVIVISVVMLTAFAVVYLIIYNNVQSQNQTKLEAAMTFYQSMQGEVGVESGDFSFDSNSASNTSMSISVVINSKNEIIQQSSTVHFSDSDSKALVSLTAAAASSNGKLSYNQRKYIYTKTPVLLGTGIIIAGNSGTSDIQEILPQNNDLINITFLDVTESYQILNALLFVFCIIAVFMFAVITFISIFFANRSIKPIRQAWDKQEQFVADASHELKTPVAIISASTEALQQNKDDPVEVEKWSGNILKETDRMSRLVRDLLELASITNLFDRDKTANFNISNVLKEEIVAMEALAYEKGITLTQDVQQDISCNGNQERVIQVIRILFDNAIKYCNNGGRINITLGQDKSHIVFSISNTGKIISKAALPHIFDRFYKEDSSRKYDGSYGLGLAMAKEIVDHYNGKIFVESNENVGTIFTVKLFRL